MTPLHGHGAGHYQADALSGRVGAKAYLRLARIQTGGVTATVPVWGYIAGSQNLGVVITVLADWPVLVVLGLLGISAHFFGFVHNELSDREVDAKAAYARPKPLPQGEIPLSTARAFAVAGLLAGLFWAFLLAIDAGPWTFFLSAGAAASAALYNVFGKSVVGGDLFLSLSVGLFTLSGAAVAGGPSVFLSPGPVMCAMLIGVIIFFNNAFEGGYKDRDSDGIGGKKTLMLWVKEREAASPRLLLFLQAKVHVVMFMIVAALVAGPLRTIGEATFYFQVGGALALLGLGAVLYQRAIKQPDRKRMLALFALHEMCVVLLFPLVLTPYVAWLLAAGLFLCPLGWFFVFNLAMYGTLAAPDV